MGHHFLHLLRRIRYCASSPLTFAGTPVPSFCAYVCFSNALLFQQAAAVSLLELRLLRQFLTTASPKLK